MTVAGNVELDIETHQHPMKGPSGETLATDIAWIGPADADRVLLTISATHGVEGFCGSGVQIGTLRSGYIEALPENMAIMMVHALNPHGFAWLRRVTENNIDLNRNFADFSAPLPQNPGYAELADIIAPREWHETTPETIVAARADYTRKHGMARALYAVTAGQYTHPDGLFFGGHEPSWSRCLLEEAVSRRLSKAKHVAIIDYHTGLGPYGYGERICVHEPGSDGLARALDWYDSDITQPAIGDSVSVDIPTALEHGIEVALPYMPFTMIALEYGTVPREQVFPALCADNWLHRYGDPESDQGKAIKQQMRDAFYPDTDDWKQMVWQRADATQRMAIAGLARI